MGFISLTADHPYFYLCCDWLEDLNNPEFEAFLKNEENYFTKTLINEPVLYFGNTLILDYTMMVKELRCIDLNYLIEQRFRQTKIRDELEKITPKSKYRQECVHCEHHEEEKKDERGNEYDDEDSDEYESLKKLMLQMQLTKEDFNTEGEVSRIDAEVKKPENIIKQKATEGQEGRKKHMKKPAKKSELDVINRLWFKREQSPPPRNEMETYLNEIRTTVRKELHTLLFLSTVEVITLSISH
ncbi:unnamed protein product [Thelazia callipaeda]|uniref:WWE domain-containing protein n=1 Tax=Thelazia callipaeda TaxID=103827 RepID=A0A0N5D907_THECL|nr:unnamed protein product [Thelazia callipaeda]